MSNPTSGEWTENSVTFLAAHGGLAAIAAAHNAALAAEREGFKRYALRIEGLCKTGTATEAQMLAHQLGLCERENQQLREQLAAAVGLCDEVASWHRDKESTDYNQCDESPCAWCAALAKVKEGK